MHPTTKIVFLILSPKYRHKLAGKGIEYVWGAMNFFPSIIRFKKNEMGVRYAVKDGIIDPRSGGYQTCRAK